MSYHSAVSAWRTGPTVKLWMAVAFCTAVVCAAVVLGTKGAGQSGTSFALQVTGRLAFMFFWPAYVGSALALLFGPPFTLLKRYGRELGLAFASVLVVHLGIVAWLCRIGDAPDLAVFVIFGTAAAWTVLLASLSIEGLRRAVGPGGWWVVRVIGMNYIAYAFLSDFTNDPLGGGIKRVILYLPFAALAVAGPAIWVAAEALRVSQLWRKAPG